MIDYVPPPPPPPPPNPLHIYLLSCVFIHKQSTTIADWFSLLTLAAGIPTPCLKALGALCKYPLVAVPLLTSVSTSSSVTTPSNAMTLSTN